MAFSIPVTLTGYYPVNSTMEGGTKDCRRRNLYTLQQHKSNPILYPYAAVAGDFTIWPDGQRISLPDVDSDAIFRVVDTGGHFYGANKTFRYEGREPFDICLDPGTSFGIRPTTAIIFPGDDFGEPGCGHGAIAINLPSYLTPTNQLLAFNSQTKYLIASGALLLAFWYLWD